MNRSRTRVIPAVMLALGAVLLFALFIALGNWQLQRRAWKLELIERVERRVHAPPVAAPAAPLWPHLTVTGDEYKTVQLRGTFEHAHETLIQANTALGPGFWVMTPLQRDDGTQVLVNRGFVPPEARERVTRQGTEWAGVVDIQGLLRISEPDGSFLRKNDPAAARWYSRDVQAIGHTLGLPRVAPYFVDLADNPASAPRSVDAPRWPVGGLTVLRFQNNHLVYALTWYALALMVLGAGGWAQWTQWGAQRYPNFIQEI